VEQASASSALSKLCSRRKRKKIMENSRVDSVFMAKLAEQAERFDGKLHGTYGGTV